MNDLTLADICDIAARAAINDRTAAVYLHDIRGTMQALFSVVELLGRSARSGTVNPDRVEQAWTLARRAIERHEQTTLGAFQALTLQPVGAAVVDVRGLLKDVVHLVHNYAESQGVSIAVHDASSRVSAGVSVSVGVGVDVGVGGVAGGDNDVESHSLRISVERNTLQTLLTGLCATAIGEMAAGGTLGLSSERRGGDAVITLDLPAGLFAIPDATDAGSGQTASFQHKELIVSSAVRFLSKNAGSLSITAGSPGRSVLRILYPGCATPSSPRP